MYNKKTLTNDYIEKSIADLEEFKKQIEFSISFLKTFKTLDMSRNIKPEDLTLKKN